MERQFVYVILGSFVFLLLSGGLLAACKKKPRCEERERLAGAALSKAQKGELSCRKDADCTKFFGRTDCGGDCFRPIAKSGVSKVQSAIETINAKWCKGYKADGCPYRMVKCALPKKVFCNKGRCALSYN